MSTLYQISKEICHLLDHPTEETESQSTLYLASQLERLEMDFDHKVANIEKAIANLQAEETMFANESKRLAKKAKMAANQIVWLKGYVLQEFKKRQIRSAGVHQHRLTMHKSQPKVVELDYSLVAVERPEFMRPRAADINKAAILEHFKQTGEIVPGTTIELDNHFIKRG